jgi:hypothetical protein
MTTEMEVYGGMNGYVPVKDNSHGGVDLGRAANGLRVWWFNETPEEYGFVQIAYVAGSDWTKSSTSEYWVEKSHLKAVVPVTPPPAPAGEWVEYHYRIEDGKLYLKKSE